MIHIFAQTVVTAPLGATLPPGAWIAVGALVLSIVTALLRLGSSQGKIDQKVTEHGQRITIIEKETNAKLDRLLTLTNLQSVDIGVLKDRSERRKTPGGQRRQDDE